MKGIASIDGQRWKELDEGREGVQHCYVVNIAKVNLTTSEDCEFGQQLQFNSQSLIKTNQVLPLPWWHHRHFLNTEKKFYFTISKNNREKHNQFFFTNFKDSNQKITFYTATKWRDAFEPSLQNMTSCSLANQSLNI